MSALNYTRVCFEKNLDNFYYFTYTNISDFFCGYNNSIDYITLDNINNISFPENVNYESPFEFINEVEIKEIKFIKNYKYAYYKIYNPSKDKTYYGIIDITKNLVVFNTDEEIVSYQPFTKISMLAITQTKAYEVCVIKKDGACIDNYDCTESNYNYLLDLDGNKCGSNCEEGKNV